MTAPSLALTLLRQWAELSPLGVIVADDTGYVCFYNEVAEGMLGIRFHEQGDVPLAEVARRLAATTEEGVPLRVREMPLAIALMQHRPSHRRVRLRTLDGRRRTIEETAIPLIAPGGRPFGAMSLYWEVPAGGG
jgi:PAS domain-containing protein